MNVEVTKWALKRVSVEASASILATSKRFSESERSSECGYATD